MNMNINPWIIEALVEYERDRRQRDINLIRLEEEAIQAGVVENLAKKPLSLPGLLRQIVSRIAKWMFSVGSKFTNTYPKNKSVYRIRGTVAGGVTEQATHRGWDSRSKG